MFFIYLLVGFRRPSIELIEEKGLESDWLRLFLLGLLKGLPAFLGKLLTVYKYGLISTFAGSFDASKSCCAFLSQVTLSNYYSFFISSSWS